MKVLDRLEVILGYITDLGVDVIVNAANRSLLRWTGLPPGTSRILAVFSFSRTESREDFSSPAIRSPRPRRRGS